LREEIDDNDGGLKTDEDMKEDGGVLLHLKLDPLQTGSTFGKN
jgi:hypothetical protein